MTWRHVRLTTNVFNRRALHPHLPLLHTSRQYLGDGLRHENAPSLGGQTRLAPAIPRDATLQFHGGGRGVVVVRLQVGYGVPLAGAGGSLVKL